MEAEAHTERPPPSNGLKRRQSELSEQESKRPRTSPGKNSPNSKKIESDTTGKEDSQQEKSAASGKASDARRKSGVIDEKQRSRRLFGGLLGSLSQTGDRTTKRRQEIESRRKAELQRQDDERLEDKQRRLEQLAEKRKSVRKKLEEENTRRWHDDMLSKAHFLQTTTEPRLYYKPWDLRPEEEGRIDEQVSEAKARMNDELAEIETERSKEQEEKDTHNGLPSPRTAADSLPNLDGQDDTIMNEDISENPDSLEHNQPVESAQADSHAGVEQNSNGTHDPGTANGASPERSTDTVEAKTVPSADLERETTEHDDDHIVEGEEDTVIY